MPHFTNPGWGLDKGMHALKIQNGYWAKCCPTHYSSCPWGNPERGGNTFHCASNTGLGKKQWHLGIMLFLLIGFRDREFFLSHCSQIVLRNHKLKMMKQHRNPNPQQQSMQSTVPSMTTLKNHRMGKLHALKENWCKWLLLSCTLRLSMDGRYQISVEKFSVLNTEGR